MGVLGGEISTWADVKRRTESVVAALEPEEWAGLLSRERVIAWTAAITPGLRLPGFRTDRRLPAREEVIGIVVGGQAVAYPMSILRERRSVTDTIGTHSVAVQFDAGADRIQVSVDGSPWRGDRELWLGWSEFHPFTAVFAQG